MPQLSASQVVSLRHHSHRLGRQFLYVFRPQTVFQAQVDGDQPFGFPILYKNGVGNFADVCRGHTLWVGSTAGARDKGIIRIRAVDDTVNPGAGNEYPGATATHIYTSEHEISLEDNDFLTVLAEFRLWHVDTFISDTGNIFKDWNGAALIDFPPPAVNGGTDRFCENAFQTAPVMGPHSIEWIGEAHHFDWRESWTPNPCVADDTDLDYYAIFPDGTPASSTASNGTVTWATAGARWVRLWVEDDRGVRCYWGHRLYITLDPAWTDAQARANGLYVDFQASPRQGSVDGGGHSMQFTVQVNASGDEFPDGALCVWFFQGGTQEDISGNWPHRSHIHFTGHIKKASTHKEPETGYVTFEAETLQSQMKNLPEFPNFLENVAAMCGTCTNWTEWTQAWNLTVQRAVALHTRWNSSLLEIADVLFVPDATTTIGEHEFPEGFLYDQLNALVNRDYLYRIGCDPLGTVYFNKDPQLRTVADRAGIATIMTIEAQDWREEIDFPEPLEPQTSYVMASGNAYTPPATVTPLFSEAPGPVPLEVGKRDKSLSRLFCTTQGALNSIAGLALAQANTRFPDIPIKLDGQYYIGHLFPMEFVGLDIQTADTKRQMDLSSDLFIPRRSTLQVVYDKDGAISHALVDVNVELATDGLGVGRTLTYPVEPPTPPGPDEGPDGYDWVPPSPPPPGPVPGDGNLLYFVDSTVGHVWRTRNARAAAGSVVYEDLGLVSASGLFYITLDSWDPKNTAMVCGPGGIWRTTNLDDAIPTWTHVLDLSGVTLSAFMVQSSICQQGYWGATVQAPLERNLYYYDTSDGGDTWNNQLITNNSNDVYQPEVKLEFSSHNAQKIWITYLSSNPAYTWIAYTINQGASWTHFNWGAWHQTFPGNTNHRFLDNANDNYAIGVTAHWASYWPAGIGGAGASSTMPFVTHVKWCGSYTWGITKYWASTFTEFYISDDAQAWSFQSNFPGTTMFVSGWPYDGDRFYAANNGAVAPILVSDDRGLNWTLQTGNWGAVGGNYVIYCCVPVWTE